MVSFIPMEAVGELGGMDLAQERPIQDIGSGYTYFENGDVIVAKITPCFENGKGALANSLTNGAAFGTTELHVIRANEELGRRFLFYISISDHFRKLGESEMYGAGGQKRIPDTFIKDFRVAIPPLSEQATICRFLDSETARIDSLIYSKRRSIELLEEKRLAIITHAVTKGLDSAVAVRDSGINWIGTIPTHWQTKQLRHVVRQGTIITYGIVQAGPDIEGGVPYIRTSDMAGDELPEDGYLRTTPELDASYARSKVAEGDLVIAIRATIGKPLIVPRSLNGANLTQGTAKFSPAASVSARYIRYFLRSAGAVSEFRRLGKGATFKEITLEMLRRFPVTVPPLEEQQNIISWISDKVSHLDKTTNLVKGTIDRLLEYRAAIITDAVTGKIDVRAAQDLEPEEATA